MRAAVWLVLILLFSRALGAQASGLQVVFGDKGLERLAYRGQVLADLERWPQDGFHIWHMRCVDEAGHALLNGQYGWGENNQGRSWDRARQTWTYRFAWGEIDVRYEVRGDALDMEVTERNRADSHIVVDGAVIYPAALHLDGGPAGAVHGDVEEPGVTIADANTGRVVLVALEAGRVLYTGFESGKDGASEVLVSSTIPDSLHGGATQGRPVKPGQTDRFVVSLRFTTRDVPVAKVAGDAYADWRTRYPMLLHWADRRVIGTVFLASSAPGDKNRSAGFPGDPRRYFNDGSVDVQGGLPAFQARVLAQAAEVVTNLKRLHAQGAITWDIEGAEYPQDTSYVCAPDQIAEISPEMESLVRDGRYAGMKLDDAYFRVIREAGLRVGVCVRPQRFTRGPDGTARQSFLADDEAAREMMRKMKYAHDRWGATLFYLDSTVRADGTTLPASVLEVAAAAMPDSLLIPEESSVRMYRVAAGYKTFLFHGDLGTDAMVSALYPAGFSVNLINDVDPAKLAAQRGALVESIRRGDVLMVHADHWQGNNATVMGMYQEARAGH